MTNSPGVATLLSRLELPFALLAGLVLLFPVGFLPLAGLSAIAAFWALRLVFLGGSARTTPLDLAVLLLLVMAAQAVYPSTAAALTMPKLYGIVLGVAVYFGVARFAGSQTRWWALVVLLLPATIAVSLLGLVATDWIADKLPGLGTLYDRLPRLISTIESSSGPVEGIHPNELGGTLAFLLPLAIGLLLWMLPVRLSRRWFPLVGPASVTLILGCVLLALTYSRSSLIGLAVASLFLVGVRWPRLGYALGGLMILGGLMVVLTGTSQPVAWVLRLDQATRIGPTLTSRQEIWSRAIYMIQDFPFTGIGLNTFPVVLNNLYPSFMPGPEAWIPHAHNIYLQTAVDLGLAGLMAFVGLWLIVGWRAAQAYRKADDPLMRGAIAGLAAGCVAYLVYGLTDAITLGAKPLVLLWVMVGLIVSAAQGEWVSGKVGEGESAAHGDSEPRTQNPELGSIPALSTQHSAPGFRSPIPHAQAQSSVLGPRWKQWAYEIGATLWWLYWAAAVLFAAIAYLVDAIALSGWMP